MGIPSGPFYVDDLLTWTSNTHTVTTGAATDADSVPTYRIYEDETGTAIATGSMAKLDDANTLGFYSEQITLSAANGYEVGKSYSIYISSTVNSVTATKSENFKVIATPATAATVSNAVWDTATAGNVDAGTFGEALFQANSTATSTFNLVNTEVADIKTVTDKLNTALVLDGAVYQYTANALELGPSGGGGSAGAVWDEAFAGHVTAGTFGKLVADINAKTTNLPPDPADASDIAASFGAIELASDAVDEIADAVWAVTARTLTANTNLNDPTAADVADAVWDEVLLGHLTAGTTGEALILSPVGAAPADIADAVWNEALGAHLATGSTGKALDTASAGGSLTAADIATEVYDQVDGIETGLTLRQAMRLSASALFGEASGLATTTAVYRDFGDTKDRIIATVDVSGNRSAVTRDAT